MSIQTERVGTSYVIHTPEGDIFHVRDHKNAISLEQRLDGWVIPKGYPLELLWEAIEEGHNLKAAKVKLTGVDYVFEPFVFFEDGFDPGLAEAFDAARSECCSCYQEQQRQKIEDLEKVLKITHNWCLNSQARRVQDFFRVSIRALIDKIKGE